ncbi:hypothetical protein [Pricia sp.]
MFKMLKRASLAMSVVGRTGSFLGAEMRLLLNRPDMMRIKGRLVL